MITSKDISQLLTNKNPITRLIRTNNNINKITNLYKDIALQLINTQHNSNTYTHKAYKWLECTPDFILKEKVGLSIPTFTNLQQSLKLNKEEEIQMQIEMEIMDLEQAIIIKPAIQFYLNKEVMIKDNQKKVGLHVFKGKIPYSKDLQFGIQPLMIEPAQFDIVYSSGITSMQKVIMDIDKYKNYNIQLWSVDDYAVYNIKRDRLYFKEIKPLLFYYHNHF